MISVKVEGLSETERVLDRVQARVREPGIPKIWKDLLADLRDYPPPPPGSRYVRTGNLGRSWRVRFAQGRMPTLFEAANDATYAQWVQGDRQAAIHRGRWTPASEILARYEADIVREWEQEIEEAAR